MDARSARSPRILTVRRKGEGGVPLGPLARPYRISLDLSAALKYSAILWMGIATFITIGAALAGMMTSWVDWLVVVLGVASSILIAGLLYLSFRLVGGWPQALAWFTIGCVAVACAALQTGADYATQYLDHALTPGPGAPDVSYWGAFQLGFVYLGLYAANAALMQVAFASRRLREQEADLLRKEADAAQAELRILRVQLNPHFMFNALSALVGLQEAGRITEAMDVTGKLADFMRAAVDIDAAKELTVADELSVLDAYLAVEMARFGDRLRLEITCDPDVEQALMPSMLLQPLVENAMKYAVEPSMGPVTVSIGARRDAGTLVLEVRDQGKTVGAAPPPVAGLGYGLEATRARLDLAYGDQARMSAAPNRDGFAVSIELPLRTGGVSTQTIPVAASASARPPLRAPTDPGCESIPASLTAAS